MRKMDRNRVIKRKVLYVQVRFSSPLNVSSGESEWTDSDVLRDADGVAFVAGSSLAGAMRAYLKKEKNEPCLMGYSGRDASGVDIGKMSALFISDLMFDETVLAGVRDGVALNEHKTAVSESKYDMEILEAGSRAHFFLELTVREQDDEQEMEQEIGKIFCGINAKEICLGSKKTRGFGEFQVLSVAEKTYTKENYLEYADAYKMETWTDSRNQLEEWLKRADWAPSMVHVEVPLRLKGGISIRQYAAKKGEPDYMHLTRRQKAGTAKNGETEYKEIPVIPGSSLTGAIRHRMVQIIRELEETGISLPGNSKNIIDTAFGYVEGDRACASNVIVHEADIEDAKPLTMVRTGVSRFESAVKTGALYKEKTYVDGTLTLRIDVRKGNFVSDEKWMLGMLMLALKDLQNGLLAVGGQTAIGRGIFEKNGEITIDGQMGLEDQLIAELLHNMSINGGGEV